MPVVTSQEDNKMAENEEVDEESLIKYYFYKGFEYVQEYYRISEHLPQHRDNTTYGLRRKNPEYDIDLVTEEVRRILYCSRIIPGYRHVWHTLQLKGYQVPRIIVELLVRELHGS